MPQNDAVVELFCLVDGDESVFDVAISINSKVTALKRLIYAECKNSAVANIDAKDLILWKLQKAVSVGPDDTLVERVKSLGQDYTKFATRLSAEYKLLAVFQQTPSEDHLHILVQLPSVKAETSSLVPESVPALAELTGEALVAEALTKNKTIEEPLETQDSKKEQSLKAKLGRISGHFGHVFYFQGRPKVETSKVYKSQPKIGGPAPSTSVSNENEGGKREEILKAATSLTDVSDIPPQIGSPAASAPAPEDTEEERKEETLKRKPKTDPSNVDEAPSKVGAEGFEEGKEESLKVRLGRHISRHAGNLLQGKPKTNTSKPAKADKNTSKVEDPAPAPAFDATKAEKKEETLKTKADTITPVSAEVSPSGIDNAPAPEEAKEKPEAETIPAKGEDFPSKTDDPALSAPASEEIKEEKKEETLKARLIRRISGGATSLLQFSGKRKADITSPAKGEIPSKIDDSAPSAPAPEETKEEKKEESGPKADTTTGKESSSKIGEPAPSAPASDEIKEERREETYKTRLARQFSGRAGNLLQFQVKPKTTAPAESPSKIDDPTASSLSPEETKEEKTDETLKSRFGRQFSQHASNVLRRKSKTRITSTKAEENPLKIDNPGPSAPETKVETKEEIPEVNPTTEANTPAATQEPIQD